ncbi:MAG TPA: glutamine--fructose-6-phosphate transaminase (isomerizing), partial [Candidatus Babeliales bacterium]|nr:glutamine--fructose-6-phosphate transaminase (isomerizing) [Candidatus Babeliales bacterium]
KAGAISLFDFKGHEIAVQFQEVDAHWKVSDKKGHKHYMLHEIYQQKQVIPATFNYLKGISAEIWSHLGLASKNIKHTKSITLVGCGTSWHAARIAQFFFESLCKIPTHVFLASEFRYMPFFPNTESLYIFISQSGETADTLEALRLVKSHNLPTVTLTNVSSSTMARESGGILLTQAGPEIAVASTKAFTTQLTALYWLAHRIALECSLITQKQMAASYDHLQQAAYALDLAIERSKEIIVQKLAKEFAQFKHIIFLGRHISYPMALEATLKLKEISYIFSQCYPAGELKHGPIALIDQNMPIILFSNADPLLYQKLLSNAQEVKARGGRLITFAFEDQKELKELSDIVFEIPRVESLLSPMAMVGVMQFLAYHIAKERGCPIDRPRNLAKSVTVE